MKNLFSIKVVLLCLSILFISSCGSDDHSDDIVGTWQLTLVGAFTCDNEEDNFSINIETNNGCYIEDGEEVCLSGTVTITDSGNVTLLLESTIQGVTFPETTISTITVNEDDSITICSDGICENGTCSIDNDILTITTEDSFGCSNEVRARRI